MELLSTNMKIYRLRPNTDYKMIFPVDSFPKGVMSFKGKPIVEDFKKGFQAKYGDDDKPVPDIAYLGMVTYAFKMEAANNLADILEQAGEALPIYIGEEVWYALNITTISEALDRDKSEFEMNDGKIKKIPNKFVFDINKLPNTSLFKIPDDNFTDVFCIDRRSGDAEILNNFFCAVSGHNLTGLEFEEVFSA